MYSGVGIQIANSLIAVAVAVALYTRLSLLSTV